MKILQINTTVNTGSTGRIAEGIGKILLEAGHESTIAFGRGNQPSQSKKIRIGGKLNFYYHVIQTRLWDNHGFESKKATQRFIRQIEKFQPNVISLHNLHGYYLHVGDLFEFLKKKEIPVVWTFHDCWPFTGHCSYFDRVDCTKWQTHCEDCPLTDYYPQSWFQDRSYQNFEDKRTAFTRHSNLTIVTPSNWLNSLVKKSFLQKYNVKVIHNGVDLTIFRPQLKSTDKSLVLGVASIWSERKGLLDFKKLRNQLPFNTEIVLIGLSQSQIKALPEGIYGIERTESVEELASWYNKATVYVNPTYVDNFPTTNIESLACGTPVVTYNTGGSPEAIDDHTGRVVQKGDIKGLVTAIQDLVSQNQQTLSNACRHRAERHFNQEDRYQEYLELYESLAN